MANKKGSSKHQQEEYKRYQNEGRFVKNKIRRLKRHCKNFPEDKQAAKALENSNHKYVRNSFKGNKHPPGKWVRLNQLPPDERKSMKEQLMEKINSGELVVARRN